MSKRRRFRQLTLAGMLLAALIAASVAPAFAGSLDPDTQFYTPKPNSGALTQMRELVLQAKPNDARLIKAMIDNPQAMWFTKGTPSSIVRDVRVAVRRAVDRGTVPILVAYNIPFRDCAQYSAGGATTVAEYEAWIDAFAVGVGRSEAIVLLEPDGLGIIPWYNPFGDRDNWATNPNYEWCQPAEADRETAAAQRFEMLNYAVDKLKANPGTRVYLDGTHSGWLGAGDAADRLYQAGVLRADGFFLNVSNYQWNERLEKYGAWVAKCIWFGDPNSGSWGGTHFEWCASQYSPADPNDFSTWTLTDQWYKDNVESQTWVPYPGDTGLKKYVIDSSRNGQGPWTPPAGVYPDPQDWCNPPDRGVGVRPTANTGNALLDAYLWVKIPGESDGECTRGLGPAGQTVDPEWGQIDPPAGQWFPAMALDLAKNANPPLE